MTQALKMAAVGAGGVAPTYVDDVFSTYLYTGNDSMQTITNGVDLAGHGGMVWVKPRSGTFLDHAIYDTLRGANNRVASNSAARPGNVLDSLTSFNSSGFSVGSSEAVNSGSTNHASWTFRKATKFFDVVTWTGNAVVGRQIPHSLGVEPGLIFVKNRSAISADWTAYHRSLDVEAGQILRLNTTVAALTSPANFNNTRATSANFTVGNGSGTNANPSLYVAYLFAHDAATDGLIQCGSFTTDGSGNATVNLGWEPQWVMLKTITATGDWQMVDAMRGMVVGGDDQALYANLSSAETAQPTLTPTATGFDATALLASNSFVYIAIRRPNKPPTVGTQVFDVDLAGTSGGSPAFESGFPVDWAFEKERSNGTDWYSNTRLTGLTYLGLNTSTAEQPDLGSKFDYQSGYYDDSAAGGTGTLTSWNFHRAPGFFDVVAYTGNGADPRDINHSLSVLPELLIIKSRGTLRDWMVGCQHLVNDSPFGNPWSNRLSLNTADAKTLSGVFGQQDKSPTRNTSSTFRVSSDDRVNGAGISYIAYLFATLPGISKVGSYIGNGSSQTINCGFTTGARFVLIKRTDATGDWLVWDTVRGIVSGNDPHLSLNTTTAEGTTDDSIDPATSGFIVNQLSATDINVNAATYIFLAIA